MLLNVDAAKQNQTCDVSAEAWPARDYACATVGESCRIGFQYLVQPNKHRAAFDERTVWARHADDRDLQLDRLPSRFGHLVLVDHVPEIDRD